MSHAPLSLGVLVSGSGTNLQAILDAIREGRLHARVRVVLSNKPNARALERAEAAGIPAKVIDHTTFPDRLAFDAAVVDALRAHEVDVVVLAGFMRLVTPVLLDAYPWRVVNVHPALLPAFPGTHAHRQVLAYGAKVTGCTVHFVDAGTDTGPILAQAAVPVEDDDDEASLGARVLVQEHALLPAVLQWIAERRVHVEAPVVDGGRPRVVVARGEGARRKGEVRHGA